jgi:hypothetical protein
MNSALLKPVLWVLASAVLVGSTVGGVAVSLTSHGRPASTISSTAPLYGSNAK